MEVKFIPYESALIAYKKGFKMQGYGIGWYYKRRSAGEIHGLDTFYIDTNQNIEQWNALDEPVEAIIYQQLVDWFRDVHHLHFYICPQGDRETWSLSGLDGWNVSNIGKTNVKTRDGRLFYDIRQKYDGVKFNSYYEALDKAIEEAFKLISI